MLNSKKEKSLSRNAYSDVILSEPLKNILEIVASRFDGSLYDYFNAIQLKSSLQNRSSDETSRLVDSIAKRFKR